MRLSKQLIREKMDRLIVVYEKSASKKFDPSDGTHQLPLGNMQAAIDYGAILALRNLLQD